MKEKDIRNPDTLNKYISMVADDIRRYFHPGDFILIKCPSCGARDTRFEFEKSEFRYVTCTECSTLFVNPRPDFNDLKKFYNDSPSTRFWINEFFKPVAEARRAHIFHPRAEYIMKSLNLDNNQRLIGDIGAGFGIFLEELKILLPGNRYMALEPSSEMSGICRDKGLDVITSSLEDVQGMDGEFDLLTAFELLEHLHDPERFFKKTHLLLRNGGFVFLTALNGMGFDTMLLWEKSRSITPPHHLNFFNPSSVRILLEKTGFEIMEISTPGKIDWDIVEGMIKREGLNLGRFWNHIAHSSKEECKSGLQNWIATNGLSSHMRILARKRDGYGE